jgi:hypothetical protein
VRRGDSGAGIVSTFIGAVVFLLFLLFAAQLLLGLYAESVVSAVAYDAAKTAAGADGRVALAEADARRQLGADIEFRWSVSDDAVRLTVRVPRWGRGPVERTVTVRAERVR